jgi:hypothetical protein
VEASEALGSEKVRLYVFAFDACTDCTAEGILIIITAFICWLMLMRWQIRHIHNNRGWSYLDHYRYGDRLTWRGYKSTAIDVKQYDMVIRRDLSGLIWRGR